MCLIAHWYERPCTVRFNPNGKGGKRIPSRFFNPEQTTADVSAHAQNALRGAQMELVEKMGHLLPLEQPEQFNRLLQFWLKSCDEVHQPISARAAGFCPLASRYKQAILVATPLVT